MADDNNESTATLDPAVAEKSDPSATTESSPNPDTGGDAEYKAFMSLVKESKDDGGATDNPDETASTDASDKPEAEAGKKPDQPADGEVKISAKANGLLGSLKLKAENAVDAAIEAYKRDGALSDEDIEHLYGKDPAAFIERGLGRAKAQRDQDEYGFEYRQWKAKATEDGQGGKPAEPQLPELPADVQAVIDAGLKPLNNDSFFNPSDANEVNPRKVFGSALSSLAATYEKKLADISKSQAEKDAAIQAHFVELRLASERSRLMGDYPDLKDDGAFGRVLERYDALVDSERRLPTVAENFAAAAGMELGSAATIKLKEKLLSRASQQKNGQPRATTSNSPGRGLSMYDAELLAFNKLYRKHYGETAA